jgi:hypothetical protein
MQPQVHSEFVYPHIGSGDEAESEREYREDVESRSQRGREENFESEFSPRNNEFYDQQQEFRTHNALPERLDTIPGNTESSMTGNDPAEPEPKLSLSIRSASIP